MCSINISSKKKTLSPYQSLVENLKLLLMKHNIWNECYIKDIPKHWERHGDLIILPSSCFSDKIWNDCPDFWKTVVNSLKCRKLARKYSVKADSFRSPQVELLFGEDGWITCVENGIKYTYDATKCMFSMGNITEKIRISKFDCSGETVIDMYAGIGYFTLPYLVHAKASVVHACEWNPYAVEALEKNLILNKVNDRCIIHFGDCRKVCPVGKADRVNLGLIPTSESGWRAACLALNTNKGGMLHIHCNVTSSISNREKTPVDSISNKNINALGSDPLEENHSDHNKPSQNQEATKNNNNGCKSVIQNAKEQWRIWGNETVLKIKKLLFQNYGVTWNVTVLHVEHVKSYAPHIDHLVADIECRP